MSDFKNFATQSFAAFLPKNYVENMPELGSPYHITPFGSEADDPIETRLGRVSSNRCVQVLCVIWNSQSGPD